MQTLSKTQTSAVSGGAILVPSIIFIYEMIFTEMLKDLVHGELQELGKIHNKPTGTRP